MALDPRIPMSFNPTQIGPDLAAAMQGARSAWQVDAYRRDAQGLDATKKVFADPASLDKDGNPTPEAMRQVMTASPEVGMKLRENVLLSQERQLQSNLLKSKTFQQQYQMTNGVAEEALVAYQTAMDGGAPKDAAMKRGQEVWTQGLDRLRSSGQFSEAQQQSWKPQFDPATAQSHAWSYGDYMKWKHQSEQEDLAQRKEDRLERDAGNTPSKAAERDAETIAAANIATKAKELGRPLTPAEEAVEHQNARMAPKITEAAKKQEATVPEGEALDKAAKWYHETHELPPGFGGQATRKAVMEREAKMYPGTVFNVATMADVKADRGSLNNLQKQRDAATAYSKTADKEFDNLLGAIPKTAEPLNMQFLTNWVRTGSRQLGGTQVPVWNVYLVSALDEYAKVIAGATGAAGSTDASRAQAATLIPEGSTSAQIKQIVPAIKQGLKNRTDGYDTTISEIQRRLSDEPAPGRAGQAAPSDADRAYLKANPDKKALFIKRFGQSEADKTLGQ